MAIGGATFPPRQHMDVLVHAAQGLAHGVVDPVARPSCGVVALGGGCPCCDRGVAMSATMVRSDFLGDDGGRKEEEAATATKVPDQLRTQGTSGRRWHAWRPSWHQVAHSRRWQCTTLVMEAAGRLMSPVMVQQFL
jgi:hypothetical protein